jgi:hypothetical protein
MCIVSPVNIKYYEKDFGGVREKILSASGERVRERSKLPCE